MKNIYILYVSAIVLFIVQNVIAQDTLTSKKEIDDVVITYQGNEKTPITFQNIYSKEIKIRSIGQEPSFLLSETPSITNFSDAGNSQGYSYYRLRGIDQTRINTTFDGMPMNEPEDQGAYFSNYPDIFNSVSKIQIQRGVGTTKNGMASFAGNLQLFSPNLMDSAKTTFGLGYGSFNSVRAFGEFNSGVKNHKAIYARISQIYTDGYKFHSGNNSQSAFVSAGLFYDKTIWKLNILAGNQKNSLAWLGVSDSLIQVNRKTNANHKNEKDSYFQTFAQLQNFWNINTSSSLHSSIYYTFLNGYYHFDWNHFIGLPSTDELFKYAVKSNLLGFFSNYTFSKNKLNWTSGIHGNLYNRQHIGSEKTLGQMYQNKGLKNEMSVFSKADFTVNILTFFADIQYRTVNFDYKGTVEFQKINWNFFNPKAGITANVNKYSTVYYSIGFTRREPTRTDMFGGNDDLLADSLGNAILFNTKPESVIDHELGFRVQNKRMNFNTNLYYMDFKNEIVLDGKLGPNALALTNNVEKSYRAGLELSLHYVLSKYFTLSNNSSFNYSRIKEQNEIFSPILTPPMIVNQEIIFTRNNLSFALIARYQHSSFMDFANSTSLKSYFLLNSRISYQLHKIHFSLFFNNITNAKYFNQGYVDYDGTKKYFVQAPLNYYISIQYSF